MKRFDNIEFAGFQVSGDVLMKVDEIIGQVANFAAKANGDNYINSGVEPIGNGNYSDGYIVWNGEILAFQGGAKQEQVTIIETRFTATYQDGQNKGYYKDRYARFGTDGVETFDFDALKPVYAKFAEQVFNNGVILPWGKPVDEMPRGFAPCDGVDGRPDLGGRFLVGHKAGNASYNAVGNIGGLESVALGITQIPKHAHNGSTNHNYRVDDAEGSAFQPDGHLGWGIDADSYAGGNSSGGTDAHENRPPYYVVAYMIWVGFN